MFKKKKRGGDKEKKVRKKCLNERETVSYEQQILDNNRQLSRFVSLGHFAFYFVSGSRLNMFLPILL